MKILPTRLGAPLLATKRCGMVRARCCTMAWEKSLTVSQSNCRRIGTTTCRPLPPLVLRKPANPSSVRKPWTSCAASCIWRHCTPSPGSRSNVMRSGLPMAVFTPFQEWNSITFICGGDFQHRRMARKEGRVELLDARHPIALRVLLEEQLAADARGRAYQRDRP